MKRVSIATHSGGFHADDVFSVAALLLVLEGKLVVPDVVRTREPSVYADADFVVDVGGVYDEGRDRFDHHQIGGAGVRGNGLPAAPNAVQAGIPYASFGLVWKKYGVTLSGSHNSAARVEDRLVIPIDAHDSGVPLAEGGLGVFLPYLVQDVITSLEPTWREEANVDAAFGEAVAFAKRILSREIVHARDTILGEREIVRVYEAARDRRIIVLDRNYDWNEFLASKPEPLFVVEPERSSRGTWRVYAVRTDPRSFESRELLPATWAGRRDAELAEISGVPDAVFCHNQRFVAVAGSKEGAIALAHKALVS